MLSRSLCVLRRAREAELKLNVSRTIKAGQGKKNVEKSVTWAVPHCRRCERSTKAVFLAGCVPFALGFVLCGLAALVVGAGVATYYDDGSTSPLGSNTSWQVGVVVGLVAGLLGGVVFELLARIVLLPLYGRALWNAPLFSTGLFGAADYVAGLDAKMSADGTQLQLRFADARIAGEFAALNAARLVAAATA